MKKLFLLFALTLVLVSCGDDKDEPKAEVQTMSTEFLKGKAFQNVNDQREYIIFTKSQKSIDFIVKETDKKLWLYHEWDFVVKDVNNRTCLCRTRTADGQVLSPTNPIWLDWSDQWQNYTYQRICIESDLGYAGVLTSTCKYVGTADEVLSKFASYTKD